MTAISRKYADYVNEIQVSHKLGYTAYRVAPEGSSSRVVVVVVVVVVSSISSISISSISISSSSSCSNAASIKGDRGI